MTLKEFLQELHRASGLGRHWLAVASVVSAAVVVVAFVWAAVALGPSRQRMVVAVVQFGVAVEEPAVVDLAVLELVVVAAVDQGPESVERASAVGSFVVL